MLILHGSGSQCFSEQGTFFTRNFSWATASICILFYLIHICHTVTKVDHGGQVTLSYKIMQWLYNVVEYTAFRLHDPEKPLNRHQEHYSLKLFVPVNDNGAVLENL